jgi:hypothetical protein
VCDGQQIGWFWSLERRPLEPELEHRLDVPVARAVQIRRFNGTRAGALETRDAVAITESDHAKHRPVRKLWARMAAQHALDDESNAWPERARPRHEPRGRPLAVFTMRVWAVLLVSYRAALRAETSLMGCDTLAAEEDLDDGFGRTQLHASAD